MMSSPEATPAKRPAGGISASDSTPRTGSQPGGGVSAPGVDVSVTEGEGESAAPQSTGSINLMPLSAADVQAAALHNSQEASPSPALPVGMYTSYVSSCLVTKRSQPTTDTDTDTASIESELAAAASPTKSSNVYTPYVAPPRVYARSVYDTVPGQTPAKAKPVAGAATVTPQGGVGTTTTRTPVVRGSAGTAVTAARAQPAKASQVMRQRVRDVKAEAGPRPFPSKQCCRKNCYSRIPEAARAPLMAAIHTALQEDTRGGQVTGTARRRLIGRVCYDATLGAMCYGAAKALFDCSNPFAPLCLSVSLSLSLSLSSNAKALFDCSNNLIAGALKEARAGSASATKSTPATKDGAASSSGASTASKSVGSVSTPTTPSSGTTSASTTLPSRPSGCVSRVEPVTGSPRKAVPNPIATPSAVEESEGVCIPERESKSQVDRVEEERERERERERQRCVEAREELSKGLSTLLKGETLNPDTYVASLTTKVETEGGDAATSKDGKKKVGSPALVCAVSLLPPDAAMPLFAAIQKVLGKETSAEGQIHHADPILRVVSLYLPIRQALVSPSLPAPASLPPLVRAPLGYALESVLLDMHSAVETREAEMAVGGGVGVRDVYVVGVEVAMVCKQVVSPTHWTGIEAALLTSQRGKAKAKAKGGRSTFTSTLKHRGLIRKR
ncbi:hypothetical protein KIPB_007560 [Kipferlia bialata]|uniref:Uncharacterized protein n=1 Tax=Kipferlia bialata TaxID=797122 RepID=A0A9K3CYQ4_9EUKA|nr:hypothetical protein KIPB_007560 [Kipferlia bialata]|eukprot:g7560.t1